MSSSFVPVNVPKHVTFQTFKDASRNVPLIIRTAHPASAYQTLNVIDQKKKKLLLAELKLNNIIVLNIKGTYKLMAPTEQAVLIINRFGGVFNFDNSSISLAKTQRKRINYSKANTVTTIAIEPGKNNTILYAATIFNNDASTQNGQTQYKPEYHTAGVLKNLFYKPVVLKLDTEYKHDNDYIHLVRKAMSQVGCKNDNNKKKNFSNYEMFTVKNGEILAGYTYTRMIDQSGKETIVRGPIIHGSNDDRMSVSHVVSHTTTFEEIEVDFQSRHPASLTISSTQPVSNDNVKEPIVVEV